MDALKGDTLYLFTGRWQREDVAQALIGQVSGFYLQLNDCFGAEVLEGLEAFVILDGFESVLGNPEWESSLFAFGTPVWIAKLESLFYSKAGWKFAISLPDLRSRVGQLPHFAPLSEADIAQALSRRARVADLLAPEVVNTCCAITRAHQSAHGHAQSN